MFEYEKRFIMDPQTDCPWASKMILNPAIIKDPIEPDVLHMLFRATGPCPEKQIPGKPMPYPIFLGYAVSRDSGLTWEADFSVPAFAPALKYHADELFIKDANDRMVVNYANGCIEDPRLFYFEKNIYLSVACRTFPPGPYWIHDDPQQCMPEWVAGEEERFGSAVIENYTVTLLYKVDIDALKKRNYKDTFDYIGPLHNPDTSDDRDAFLFPRKLNIMGSKKVICIHRPKHPWRYNEGSNLKEPSIFLTAADSLTDLSGDNVVRHVLAVPEFEWEQNRIGASWAPIEISSGEWLLPYHGKQDDTVGYTQSFMILKESDDGFPVVTHRPSERMMFANEAWEIDGDFTIPCMFTCSGVILNDGRLLMGYGAADQKIGIAITNFEALIGYLKHKN